MTTTAQGANVTKTPTQVPAVVEKNISDNVLARINQFQQAGALRLPKDYSAENALKVAFLQLTDQTVEVGNNKVSVLDHCTQPSIANALLKMVTQGLNPMKRQCSFIPYGKSLTMQREYQGSIALAKRFGMKDIAYNVIYEGDTFKYKIDPETARKTLVSHEQDFENIDPTKIKGAYAVTEKEDGVKVLEVMNIRQIELAWNQGPMKGKSGAHNNFRDQMCLKTVINRACKPIINSSDDSYLFDDDDDQGQGDKSVKQEVSNEANKENLDFTDAPVIDSKLQGKKPEQPPQDQSPKVTPIEQSQPTLQGPGFE